MLILWLKAVTVFYLVATFTSQIHGSGRNSLSRQCLINGKKIEVPDYIFNGLLQNSIKQIHNFAKFIQVTLNNRCGNYLQIRNTNKPKLQLRNVVSLLSIFRSGGPSSYKNVHNITEKLNQSLKLENNASTEGKTDKTRTNMKALSQANGPGEYSSGDVYKQRVKLKDGDDSTGKLPQNQFEGIPNEQMTHNEYKKGNQILDQTQGCYMICNLCKQILSLRWGAMCSKQCYFRMRGLELSACIFIWNN